MVEKGWWLLTSARHCHQVEERGGLNYQFNMSAARDFVSTTLH
jgi:hypothetical protein